MTSNKNIVIFETGHQRGIYSKEFSQNACADGEKSCHFYAAIQIRVGNITKPKKQENSASDSVQPLLSRARS